MKDMDKEKEFTRSVKSVLDTSLEDVDGSTLVRLQAARRKALESTPKRTSGLLWTGGLATASILLLVTGFWLFQFPSTPRVNLEDIEVLAAVEDPDFYDDLEFYHWLAETDRPG